MPVVQVEDALPAGCRLLRMSDVLAKGRSAPEPGMYVAGANGNRVDPLISLFYTSGSTGLPKGAMYSESVWRRYWCALSFLTCCDVSTCVRSARVQACLCHNSPKTGMAGECPQRQ